MVAERKLRNKLADQIRTTSSSSAGLPRAEFGTTRDNCSLLAAGPSRLASTRKSTTTTMSTEISGIYMPSLPKQQLHRREATTIFEGNNKSDTTAG
eukprot:6270488-Amphidinium_carterae.2